LGLKNTKKHESKNAFVLLFFCKIVTILQLFESKKRANLWCLLFFAKKGQKRDKKCNKKAQILLQKKAFDGMII